MRLLKPTGYAAIVIMAVSFSAQGAPPDAPAAAAGTQVPMPYTAIPGQTFGAPEPSVVPPTTPPLSNNLIIATLIDGTKVTFEGGGVVMVINKDGSKSPAPDGMLTLRDGTPFVVKDGKRVSEY